MNTVHKQIEITYDEAANLWRFELRGRQRSAASLAKAREAIDKPVDEKEEKPFERCKVYVRDFYDDFGLAEATSVADSPSWRTGKEVWIVKDGEKAKVSASRCYLVNDKNTALIKEWKRLDKQMEAISDKRHAVEKRMQPLGV